MQLLVKKAQNELQKGAEIIRNWSCTMNKRSEKLERCRKASDGERGFPVATIKDTTDRLGSCRYIWKPCRHLRLMQRYSTRISNNDERLFPPARHYQNCYPSTSHREQPHMGYVAPSGVRCAVEPMLTIQWKYSIVRSLTKWRLRGTPWLQRTAGNSFYI